MRRKLKFVARLPKSTLWLSHGQWHPTYVIQQQKQTGTEYQHYGIGTDGKLVFAGVTRHSENSQATANQIIRVWRRWRWEYDRVFGNPKDTYPAKQMYSTQEELRRLVARITVFPIDSPQEAITYEVRP
jgi:hypothetical protein